MQNMVFWGVDHWELGNPEKHDYFTGCLWIYNAGVSFLVLRQIYPSQIQSMDRENTIESQLFLFLLQAVGPYPLTLHFSVLLSLQKMNL